MEEYKDQGYVVYLDNYYSSPVSLNFNDLFQNGISAYMWDSAHKPERFAQTRAAGNRVGSGSACSIWKGDLMVLKWKDKKDVYMLSTKHNNDYAETGKK